VCEYHYAQMSYTTQHKTILIIFPLILQTIIIAQMMSTGGNGDVGHVPNDFSHLEMTRSCSSLHMYYARCIPSRWI